MYTQDCFKSARIAYAGWHYKGKGGAWPRTITPRRHRVEHQGFRPQVISGLSGADVLFRSGGPPKSFWGAHGESPGSEGRVSYPCITQRPRFSLGRAGRGKGRAGGRMCNLGKRGEAGRADWALGGTQEDVKGENEWDRGGRVESGIQRRGGRPAGARWDPRGAGWRRRGVAGGPPPWGTRVREARRLLQVWDRALLGKPSSDHRAPSRKAPLVGEHPGPLTGKAPGYVGADTDFRGLKGEMSGESRTRVSSGGR